MKKIITTGLLLVASAGTQTAVAKSASNNAMKNLSAQKISQLLGWVNDPNSHNLCGGYYIDESLGNLSSDNSQIIHYHGDRSEIGSNGVSKLIGNVKISQGNKQVTADNATFVRNEKTNHPQKIAMQGNVELKEPGGLIYANKLALELKHNEWQIWNVLYRASLKIRSVHHNRIKVTDHKDTSSNAWGHADEVSQKKAKVWELKNATYTTCKPDCHVWHIAASKIVLDKKHNIGTAKNAKLYVHGIPVFWFPYFRFPLSNQRQSGILVPSYGTSSSLGFNFNLPIYWNIAPNYDDIFSPIFTQKRGVLLNNYFRYLTDSSQGTIRFNFTPNDNQFKQTKNNLIHQFANDTKRTQQVNDLKNDSATRYYLDWNDKTQLNQHLFAKLDYNRVSDDYYMEDYFNSGNNDYSNANQLNQQLNLDYYAKKWRLDMDLQHYQTLHPLDQADILNQYDRLPQITFNGTAGYSPYGIQFSLNTSFTDFAKDKNPFDTNINAPTTGDRLNFDPTISLPYQRNAFFIKPTLQFDVTGYDLRHPNPGADNTPSRALPIFDIDSGLYFDKMTSIFNTNYIATLEPHFYYLYVPYRDQNNLPLFDTIDNSLPLSFDYDQMFVTNRFSDLDRIGDANQITLAVTSQLRNADTGKVKAYASLGEIYYFKDRRVLACTNTNSNNPNNPHCPGTLPSENRERVSPMAAQLYYNIVNNWSLGGDFVYNPRQERVDNQTYILSYEKDSRHILNFSYTYARGTDGSSNYIADDSSQSIDQTGVSGYWPLSNHWSAMGSVNYSFAHRRFQSYLYGVEYDSCCWGVRAVINRAFIGLNPAFSNSYDNRFYIQFTLNGLTSLGTNDPGDLLMNNIENYHDRFGHTF